MLKQTLALVLFSGLLLTFGYIAFANPANPVVLMKTSKGDITVELFADKAPITVKNFLSYADNKFYDGTIFHRVIKGFMIQGGGLTSDFQEKATKPPIKNEAASALKNLRGTIAMARTPDINSATSQFFINHVDNAFLDHKDDTLEGYGYAVFGKVTKGIEVVDAIANAPTGTIHGYRDAPRETIAILSITRVGE
jgi:cyclophilin family peptidyl-prolyl cis-trans isomerase